jgi:hypothetical protein
MMAENDEPRLREPDRRETAPARRWWSRLWSVVLVFAVAAATLLWVAFLIWIAIKLFGWSFAIE